MDDKSLRQSALSASRGLKNFGDPVLSSKPVKLRISHFVNELSRVTVSPSRTNYPQKSAFKVTWHV